MQEKEEEKEEEEGKDEGEEEVEKEKRTRGSRQCVAGEGCLTRTHKHTHITDLQ